MKSKILRNFKIQTEKAATNLLSTCSRKRFLMNESKLLNELMISDLKLNKWEIKN